MGIITSSDQGVYIVMPSGSLDTTNAPEAEALILKGIEGGETKIIIDFSKTDYISSAGLRVILKAAKLLKQKEGRIALCNAKELTLEVLEMSGLLDMFKVHDDLDSAIAAVSG